MFGNQFLQENKWFDNHFDSKTRCSTHARMCSAINFFKKTNGSTTISIAKPCKLPYFCMSMAHARVFSLKKARFCVSVRAGSLGGEPTARDSPQNYKGIDALQTLQLFILREV